MEKKTLSHILEGKIFEIPDYQRGYAWEMKQWDDFTQDIDALIDDEITSHYTGTIVIYQKQNKPTKDYGTKKLEIVEVVDGQQRLTTASLYLAIIINKLIDLGMEEYKDELAIFLYKGAKTKLILNNDTSDFFADLISKGCSNMEANSVHQKRLADAYVFLQTHIEKELGKRGEQGNSYLINLFDAIIRKLNFSFYTIELESEIGMTFELMNSRGKDLSSLELLKNYLMHWVYRNIKEPTEKVDTTNVINKNWKEVYVNIAKCNGSESQCLRIAWTLLIDYTPKNWSGYSGFKSDHVLPLRNFSIKSKIEVKNLLINLVNELSLISKHYAAIINPNNTNCESEELNLLKKIRNAGNIATFLPLMVAAKIKHESKEVSTVDYVHFLKAIEKFSYRVFLWEGKRSNSGLSKFYRWAEEIYTSRYPLPTITNAIYETINWYSPEESFRKELIEDFYTWYHHPRLLKYTLFEYELSLLGDRNKPKLNWEDLSEATIEHILPQNPQSGSNWNVSWTKDQQKKHIHDIGNLVLTIDNSRYSNFDFDRKKGVPGIGYSYSNSDIKQERVVAKYEEWNVENCTNRRNELTNWILANWGIESLLQTVIDVFIDEEEDFVSYEVQ